MANYLRSGCALSPFHFVNDDHSQVSSDYWIIGADTMRHRGARASPTFDLSWALGGTDNRYETFDTLENWALGSHLANKDTAM